MTKVVHKVIAEAAKGIAEAVWEDDAAYARAFYLYDPTTGQITAQGGRRWVRDGKVLGTVNSAGYVTIAFRGTSKHAHRLAWFLTHGVWPAYIDHVNGDRRDNRLENLRAATQSQNMANARIHVNSTTGFKGVSYRPDRSKWQATIQVHGRSKYLGLHPTPQAAHAAYLTAAQAAFGEFARAA